MSTAPKTTPPKPYPPMDDEYYPDASETGKDWTIIFLAVAATIFMLGAVAGSSYERERGCKNMQAATFVNPAPQAK